MNAVQALNAAFAVTEQELLNTLRASQARESELVNRVDALQAELSTVTQSRTDELNTVRAELANARMALEEATKQSAELLEVRAALSETKQALETAQLLHQQTKQEFGDFKKSSEKAETEYSTALSAARLREQSLNTAVETLKACFTAITTSHEKSVSDLSRSLQNDKNQLVSALQAQINDAKDQANAWQASHAQLVALIDKQSDQHHAEIQVIEAARITQNLHFENTVAQLQAELARVHKSKTWQLHELVTGMFSVNKATPPAYIAVTPETSAPVHDAPLAISPSTMVPYTTMSNPTSITPATTLGQLLSYHDETFVICAYRTILGRSPDAHGLKYYVEERLAKGISKIEVIKQLYSSSEAKTFGCDIPGLNKAVLSFKRGNLPLVGWAFRLFDDCERKHPIDNKLRAIEHTLYALRRDNQVFNARFDQLIDTLAKGGSLGNVQATPTPVATIQSAIGQEVQVDMSMLAPQGKEIYKELKVAIATNKGNS